MKDRRRLGRAMRIISLGALAAMAATPACLTRPVEAVEPRTTSTIIEQLGRSSVDKIDLLLAIDNSSSMADKQDILSLAVPDLVGRLVNPLCVDDANQPAAQQPAGPTADCPDGSQREFPSILDIHIGIVTSSLGGHGSDVCPDAIPHDTADCDGADATNTTNDDHGHLVARKSACGGIQASTYGGGLGFLAWDPAQKDKPAGVADVKTISSELTELVHGIGQVGCGFESQNEAWLRFLVDPAPYKSIAVQGSSAVKAGIDQALLKERADFLRPSSVLAIVLLTDENDCSAREGGQYYIFEQLSGPNGPYHLPPPRAECKTNPLDPCCKSCAQPAGACPADLSCSTQLDTLTDSVNLRCFDQKRRFGLEFLYPWQRYVNALTQPMIDPTAADLGGSTAPNPIYSDLQPGDGDKTIRTTDLVFLAGIIGVPWQDVARDPTDLVKGYKSAAELAKADGNGMTAWDVILGDPAAYVAPKDPHMIEQIDPRPAGAKDPITGDAIAPPGSPAGADKINGHEYTNKLRDNLQYACVFDLPPVAVRDCSQGQIACDCDNPQNDDPLCSANPNDGNQPTLQTRAKGYPGLRHLQILKGLGDQGIVASVCAKQVGDPGAPDFGYRPAVAAIVERIRGHLQ